MRADRPPRIRRMYAVLPAFDTVGDGGDDRLRTSSWEKKSLTSTQKATAHRPDQGRALRKERGLLGSSPPAICIARSYTADCLM
jgi:hypothetical protein